MYDFEVLAAIESTYQMNVPMAVQLASIRRIVLRTTSENATEAGR